MKEARNEVHFFFLMELARHVQSTRNRKLILFLQYLEKKVLQLLLCYNVIKKHSGALQGYSHVPYYLLQLKFELDLQEIN